MTMPLRCSQNSATTLQRQTLYFSASLTIRSMSSLDRRPLSLVMVILFLVPAAVKAEQQVSQKNSRQPRVCGKPLAIPGAIGVETHSFTRGLAVGPTGGLVFSADIEDAIGINVKNHLQMSSGVISAAAQSKAALDLQNVHFHQAYQKYRM